MSRKSTRFNQLLESSVNSNRDAVKSGRLLGMIRLFNKDLDMIVGCYSFEYVPGYESLDIDYLLSKLETWSCNYPGYALLLSRESTGVNDLANYVLKGGAYAAAELNLFCDILDDYRTNAYTNAGHIIKHLVPRINLASVLAPLYIVETTEADIRSCAETQRRYADIQRSAMQRGQSQNFFGNM